MILDHQGPSGNICQWRFVVTRTSTKILGPQSTGLSNETHSFKNSFPGVRAFTAVSCSYCCIIRVKQYQVLLYHTYGRSYCCIASGTTAVASYKTALRDYLSWGTFITYDSGCFTSAIKRLKKFYAWNCKVKKGSGDIAEQKKWCSVHDYLTRRRGM